MKKFFSKLILGIWILTASIAVGQEALGADKLATLVQPSTNTKKIVTVGSQDAQKYFGLGYVLDSQANLLGAPVISTGYAERLTLTITKSATTIYVSTVNDRDGNPIALSATSKGYFTLDPGTSREESVVCAGYSTTTPAFTNCTRGLPATGSSEIGNSNLAFSHNAGSTIIMTDIAQFFNTFVDVSTDQTIYGNKTFASSSIFQNEVNFVNNPTTTTSEPISDNQIITKKYVDDTAISGGVKATDNIYGISKLSVSAASTTIPIVVGDNDPRIPTVDENDALVGTFGTPNATNKFVTNDDTTGTGSIIRENALIYTWGDGSDGDIIISTSTSLLEDMNYNTLVILNGGVLNTNGYKIFARSIDIQSGGAITVNGGNGGAGVNGISGGAGGSAGTVAHNIGTLIASSPGEIGGSGADVSPGDGVNGDNRVNSISTAGNNGGSGGAGAGGAGGAGGSGGSISTSVNNIGSFKNVLDFYTYNATTFALEQYQSSAGAGSGGGGRRGGDASILGGGGGGSGAVGGFIYIVANNIIINGMINANGGVGGSGGAGESWASGAGGTGGGGGAGGNAGTLILACKTLAGSGAVNLVGGAGGAGGIGGNSAGGFNGGGGGSGGDGGNGGEFYKIFQTDNSTLTVALTGGSAGIGGAAGTGGTPNPAGSNGIAGSIGTTTSIHIY